MSRDPVTEPTKIVLDSVARGVIASAGIAFVWVLLFAVSFFTGWFAPWWVFLVVCPRNDLAVARTWPNGSSNGDSGPNRRNASQIKRQLVQGTHH